MAGAPGSTSGRCERGGRGAAPSGLGRGGAGSARAETGRNRQLVENGFFWGVARRALLGSEIGAPTTFRFAPLERTQLAATGRRRRGDLLVLPVHAPAPIQ